MAAHFHLCEQCGEQYVCREPGDPCITRQAADRMYRLCVDCAEVEPSSYEPDAYNAARARDEQRGDHIASNSDLGKSIAKRVKSFDDDPKSHENVMKRVG